MNFKPLIMKSLMLLLAFMGAMQLNGQVTIDFTSPSTATYGTDAQKNENGTMVMWAGDVNGDQRVRYSDLFIPPFTLLPSDALAIYDDLDNDPANQKDQYSNFDVNMDGKVRYSDLFIPPFTFIPSDALFIYDVIGNDPGAEILQQF